MDSTIGALIVRNLELRAEYTQLWSLCLEALRQITAVLGDTPMDLAAFRDTLHAVLSEYDIGLIPVALDRVSAGDFDRMRRRNIRRLIVLGCTAVFLLITFLVFGLTLLATDPQESYEMTETYIKTGSGKSSAYR